MQTIGSWQLLEANSRILLNIVLNFLNCFNVVTISTHFLKSQTFFLKSSVYAYTRLCLWIHVDEQKNEGKIQVKILLLVIAKYEIMDNLYFLWGFYFYFSFCNHSILLNRKCFFNKRETALSLNFIFPYWKCSSEKKSTA